jgi:hypothetical protein
MEILCECGIGTSGSINHAVIVNESLNDDHTCINQVIDHRLLGTGILEQKKAVVI